MQSDVKRVFYYNTSANALGGFIENPYAVIPSQGSVSLPSVGGAESIKSVLPFRFDETVASATAYSHAAGRQVYGAGDAVKRNGPWTTRAVSVVEKLDIAGGVLTADLVVARINIEHSEDGGHSKISFRGSQFRNLRINNKPVRIDMHPEFCPAEQKTIDDYYDEGVALSAEIEWPRLWNAAKDHSRKMHEVSAADSWIRDRFRLVTDETKDKEGHAICSLVDRIEDGPEGMTFGHVFDIPDVGRFFLGEVTVQRRSVQVTMVRAELGCKTAGHVSAASARGNGVPFP